MAHDFNGLSLKAQNLSGTTGGSFGGALKANGVHL